MRAARIFFALVFMLLLIAQADAQRRSGTDKYFEEKGNLASRLWYGGGFNLGLAGGNDFSQFVFGLAPMVGYKITDEFSIGPRVGFFYQYVRGNAFVYSPDFSPGRNPVSVTNEKKATVSFSGAVFARYKAFQNFFAHIEFEVENRELFLEDRGLLIYEQNPGELLTLTDTRENFYAGIGYTSGYPLGFEMSVLYNFNEPENTIELPFDFRFGINYNF